MTVEENVRVVIESIDAINERDWERFDKAHADSIVASSPQTPEPTKGRAEHRAYVEGFVAAFPDLRVKVERTFGQDDWVSLEFVATGTHKGPLAGPGGRTIPATNKPVRVPYSIVSKVEGGELTEEYHYFDLLGMMAQLGLAP